jgi:altronate dehydratase small subunit
MENSMKNAIIIEESDNVLVAIEPIAKGDDVCFVNPDGQLHSFTAKEDIPIYHKLARKDIGEGQKLCKYGEHIGQARNDIAQGMHVHTHNVLSVRENLD